MLSSTNGIISMIIQKTTTKPHLKTRSIILAVFLRVIQDVVGKGDLLKHVGRNRVICSLIRMVPETPNIDFGNKA